MDTEPAVGAEITKVREIEAAREARLTLESCVCGDCYGCPDGYHSTDEDCSCTASCAEEQCACGRGPVNLNNSTGQCEDCDDDTGGFVVPRYPEFDPEVAPELTATIPLGVLDALIDSVGAVSDGDNLTDGQRIALSVAIVALGCARMGAS